MSDTDYNVTVDIAEDITTDASENTPTYVDVTSGDNIELNVDADVGDEVYAEVEHSEDIDVPLSEAMGDISADHRQLINRGAENQHPIVAITGLSEQLTSLGQHITTVEERVTTVEHDLGNIFNIFYPKGSYYETSLPATIPSESVTPTASDLAALGSTWFDPNYAWGGTWELETAGLVHIGAGTGYTLGATGGEATHQLTESELPKISGHWECVNLNTVTAGGKMTKSAYSSSSYTGFSSNSRAGSQVTLSFGNDGAHNNMQPYIVVNRWHRTA